MRKFVVLIVLTLLAAMLISLFSSNLLKDPSPIVSDVTSDVSSDSSTNKTVNVTTGPVSEVTTSYPVDPSTPIDESVFIYHSDGYKYAVEDLSSVPENTRGYFVYEGNTYFAVKRYVFHGHITSNVAITDYNYDTVLMFTTDMENIELADNDIASPRIYEFAHVLIVYYVENDCSDPVSLNEDLIANISIESMNIICDPDVPEGPSDH